MKNINTHGLKMVGLRKVSGETKGLEGRYGRWHLQLNYNTATGELWTNTHVSSNSQTVYDDANIKVIAMLSDPYTMQELADMVADAVNA